MQGGGQVVRMTAKAGGRWWVQQLGEGITQCQLVLGGIFTMETSLPEAGITECQEKEKRHSIRLDNFHKHYKFTPPGADKARWGLSEGKGGEAWAP